MTAIDMRRATYRDLSLYAPDRAPARIDLSDNTSAWGTPPAARRVIAAGSEAARYPSLYSDDLKRALSKYTGAAVSMITTGCGSDDVLDSTLRALAEPGDRVAYSAPTFPMVPILARMNGLTPVAAPLDEIADIGARIIYLCSPNNPTGETTPRRRVARLIQRLSAEQVLVIDEAYAEFAEDGLVDLAVATPRVILTRTLSKAFGLAGLRVGYAIGDPLLITEVEKSRGPYKVSAVAERAAIAALTEDLPWVREHVAIVIDNRVRLSKALTDRGLAPLSSAANFVFVPIADAVSIARVMRAQGVAVRAFEEPSGLRITVGTWPQISEALHALDEARAQCE